LRDCLFFQQGGIEAFCQYVKTAAKFPASELNKKQKKSVFLQFGVDCYGNVKVFSVMKSSGSKALDNEAKRAVKSSPKWTPAKTGNKSVGKLYYLQVKFNVATKKVEVKEPEFEIMFPILACFCM